MYKLIYKEFTLAVHPFFLVMPILTGALMLIPGWLYLLVLMYFCFITVPNVLAGYKTNNDMMFSNLMPVRRKDIVGSRILMVMILEVLHILVAIVFAVINKNLYDSTWFLFIQPNVAYFGVAFIMFAIFNIVIFSIYFKSGYFYGVATVAAITVIIAFGGILEYVALKNVTLNQFFKGSEGLMSHIWLLIVGIILFVLFGFLSYTISVKRFEKVDI